MPLPEGEDVGPVRPAGANGAGPDHDADDDGDDDFLPPPTTVAGGRVEPAAAEDEDESESDDADGDDDTDDWTADDESEGVRVLGRRRRRTPKGDEPPVEPLPGTAAIGARHIVPGDMGRSGLGPWIARAAAILALAFVVAAVLLVVYGMR
jgi:hypothetical protein